jgi:hypothetical protein
LSTTIPRVDHCSELWIEGGNSVNSPDKQPVSSPKATEDLDEAGQHGCRVRLLHHGTHSLHAPIQRKLIEQGLKHPCLCAKEVVNGLPGNSAVAGQCVQCEVEEAVRFQLRTRSG